MEDKKRNEAVEAAQDEAKEAKLNAPRELPDEVLEQIAGGRPEIHRPPQV